jgi:hypothetical protein
MAEHPPSKPTTDPVRPDPLTLAPKMDEPLPAGGDPGGADAKGYSADPRPEADVPPSGPVPLTPAPDGSAVHQPEREGKAQPTGRRQQHYDPNDRMLGSDS